MRGIILTNVGTPANCTRKDVQRFIAEMLSDPLVFGQPKWFSSFIARNIIVPLSSSKSLEKYKQIWRTEEPKISPILYHMQILAKKLEESKNIPVEIAFRYGEMNIERAIKSLEKKCPLLHEVVIFPLFPHYAQSTIQTTVDETGRIFFKKAHSFRLKMIKPYFDHPAYINALAKNAQPYLNNIDRLVFTYHSLPINQVEAAWKKGKDFDYVYQLKETNHLFCEKLNIDPRRTLLLYSSQRGNNWLKPFLNSDVADLPKLGWRKVAVVAPGFTIDNMETLYDIEIETKKIFMNAGGEKLTFVPCLNDSELWIEAIWKIISGV